MKKPVISVLIPSYNHAPYIGKAIESVINQTFKDIEILIGDDCSPDNSREVINSYNDPRIKKYFYENNCGGSENLNKLIDMANGEYISILNSDDYWELDKLEKQYEYMKSHEEIGACFTWVQYIDRKGKKIYPKENVFIQENKTQSEWFKYFFSKGNCLCHPSILIRRRIYDEIGKYNVRCRQIPDFIEWIRLIKRYPIYIMPEALVNFRWSGDENNTSGFSVANMNRTYQEYYMLAQELFDDCPAEILEKGFDINIKKCGKNDVLLEYEKNMFLYNNEILGSVVRSYAYSNIGKLMENESNRSILEKEYDLTINNYYALGGKINATSNSSVEVVEKVPDYIMYSRGYKMLNKIYNSRFYKTIRRKK